jgi:hypothetical protein
LPRSPARIGVVAAGAEITAKVLSAARLVSRGLTPACIGFGGSISVGIVRRRQRSQNPDPAAIGVYPPVERVGAGFLRALGLLRLQHTGDEAARPLADRGVSRRGRAARRMKISADILRRLSALNLPGDGLTSVLSILADIQIERTPPGDEGINLADDFGLITP